MKSKLHWVVAVMMAMVMAVQAQVMEPGSEVDVEGLKECKWLEGTEVKKFEPGKVYIFECWATWCAPCLQSIPHMNDLHDAYSKKGLVICGMNVWETDEAKVKATAKAHKMKYAVAFTGPKGSLFDTKWLVPGKVSGIPTAFVVVDGKLVTKVHPGQLTKPAIEEWLKQAATKSGKAGGDVVAKRSMGAVQQSYRLAKELGDVEKMQAAVEEMNGLVPNSNEVVSMKLDIMLEQKKWSDLAEVIESMSDQPGVAAWLVKQTREVVSDEKHQYPMEWIKMLANTHASLKQSVGMGAMDHVGLAMMYWRVGEAGLAKEHARKAGDVAGRQPDAVGGEAGVAYFQAFAKAVEQGEMPTFQRFTQGLPARR